MVQQYLKKFIFKYQSMIKLQEILSLVFIKKLLKPPKISSLYAQVKKELEEKAKIFISRIAFSIESSLLLWLKVEISQMEMEQEVRVSMEKVLKMKISWLSTLSEDNFQWQTQGRTQMEVNFSLLLLLVIGLMESMLCLEKLQKD